MCVVSSLIKKLSWGKGYFRTAKIKHCYDRWHVSLELLFFRRYRTIDINTTYKRVLCGIWSCPGTGGKRSDRTSGTHLV